MSDILESINQIALYTGSNGKKGCTCKCIGCFLGEYGTRKPTYQGKIEQVEELLSALPNLNRVRIYGNPDISVDSSFCNNVARLLQDKGISFSFFTSGIGGAKTIETVTVGINPSSVRKVIFSVDSIDERNLSILKGVKMSLKTIIDGIECCNRLNIPFAMSIVIWQFNANDDFFAYQKFFKSYGASKIVARFGSVEGAMGRIESISEDKILEIREKYRDSSITFNYCLTTDKEYDYYLHDFIGSSKIKCRDTTGKLYVCLEEDGIKVSAYCPYYTALHPEYFTSLDNVHKTKPPFLFDITECPISEQTLGYECQKLHPVCRYYKT